MDTAALRLPVAEGLKVTAMLQCAPAATELPQVLVCVKSFALEPVTLMPEIVSAALPVLVSVTLCAALVVPVAWLAKARLVGLSETTGLALETAMVASVFQ